LAEILALRVTRRSSLTLTQPNTLSERQMSSSYAADLQYSSPDLDSSPDLSPLLLDLHLGKFVTKSTFKFHV